MQISSKVFIISRNSEMINYIQFFHLQTQKQQKNCTTYRVRIWLAKFHNYHDYDADEISNFSMAIIIQSLQES